MSDLKRKIRTGITGLDEILDGGLHPDRLYLVEGNPGTGKTTLALQFLLEGAARGETGLYITLSETADEIRNSMASHGWEPMSQLRIVELVQADALLDPDQHQSLLYSSDLELGETTRHIMRSVEDLRPGRIVIDSLAEIRLLAQGSLRFRRQVLALKHYFTRQRATVLLLDDLTAEESDRAVHSIVSGVIRLEELAPEFGAERRRLRTVKYRASRFRGGYHDFDILTGGLAVYPRLVAARHRREFPRQQVASGVPELDRLVGGGLARGTSTLVLGPAGSGKSILALHYALAAVNRGDSAAIYLFEEDVGLFTHRSAGVGLDIRPHRDAGRLVLEQVDPAELTPGEFAHKVMQAVERNGARTIVIDSLNGYQAAMPHEQHLVLHMHELLSYLNRQGAMTIMTVAHHGLLESTAPIEITYLSDAVLLLRFFESQGRVRRAISAIKNRTGPHEDTIREMQITEDGIRVGSPLDQFTGVLTGVPSFNGADETLLSKEALA